MAKRGAKKVHVLPGIGKIKFFNREKFWVFLSTSHLPDSEDVEPQRISRIDSSLIITSDLGKDPYLGELLGDGWGECQKCDAIRYCPEWDGIGRRMHGVPVAILRENDRIDGNEEMLWRLGLAGPEEVRQMMNSTTSIFNVARGLFSVLTGGGTPELPQYPPEILAAAKLLQVDLPTTKEAVEAAYKRAAFRFHPDNKEHGSADKFKSVVWAKDTLLASL